MAKRKTARKHPSEKTPSYHVGLHIGVLGKEASDLTDSICKVIDMIPEEHRDSAFGQRALKELGRTLQAKDITIQDCDFTTPKS